MTIIQDKYGGYYVEIVMRELGISITVLLLYSKPLNIWRANVDPLVGA